AHPAAHGDPDRRDLALPDPHAGASRTGMRVDAEALQGVLECPLEPAQERVEIPAACGEIADRVTHELSRTVPGDVAPARHVEQLDSQTLERGTVHPDAA